LNMGMSHMITERASKLMLNFWVTLRMFSTTFHPTWITPLPNAVEAINRIYIFVLYYEDNMVTVTPENGPQSG